MSETTDYTLKWTPVVHEGGYSFDGEPVVLAVGDWPTIRQEWRQAGLERRLWHERQLEATEWPTIGFLADQGCAYSLHIIGQGSLSVWREATS